jgi:hypothetical protein
MTRRENTQRRRQPVRRSRPLILVVCGAKCTEPQYFRSLRDGLRSRAVDIVLTQHAKAPLQVAHKRVLKHVSSYDKRCLDFGHFECGVADAIQRAKVLDPSGGRFELNPSTSVWRLVERMME